MPYTSPVFPENVMPLRYDIVPLMKFQLVKLTEVKYIRVVIAMVEEEENKDRLFT